MTKGKGAKQQRQVLERQRGSTQRRKQRSQTVEIEHRIEGGQQVRGSDKAGGRKENTADCKPETETEREKGRDRGRHAMLVRILPNSRFLLAPSSPGKAEGAAETP